MSLGESGASTGGVCKICVLRFLLMESFKPSYCFKLVEFCCHNFLNTFPPSKLDAPGVEIPNLRRVLAQNEVRIQPLKGLGIPVRYLEDHTT